MSLEQTAKQMRRQYMTTSDKYCDKHQRHYVTIQLPNSSLTLYASYAIVKSKPNKTTQGTRTVRA